MSPTWAPPLGPTFVKYAKDVGRVLVGKIDALEAIRAVVVGLLTEAMLTEILEVRGGLSRTLGRRCSVL